MAKTNTKPESTEPAKAETPPRRHDEESYKETFESVVIAFILAFVFRAYVVEAFVIPTGSMAPTLLGEHYELTCPQCGYTYTVDVNRSHPPNKDTVIPCPMCHYPTKVFEPVTDSSGRMVIGADGLPQYKQVSSVKAGDRILVQKYVNSILNRFDVVVFKAPHKPFTNYIKRLIGLQGEAIQIIEGNIYVNPTPDDESGWRIARKTDVNENPHAAKIQRTVWQPIYHSQYVPLDWNKPEMVELDRFDRVIKPGREPGQVFRVPWVVDNSGVENSWKTAGGEIELDPSNGYRHDSDARGRIRFDFARFWKGGPGFFPYGIPYPQTEDGMASIRRAHNIPVEDIRLSASFHPDKDGLNVTLRTTCRMDDEKGVMRTLMVSVGSDGQVTLSRKADLTINEAVVLAKASVPPIRGGESRTVELWYVDQEASVWIDGKRILSKAFDLPIDLVRNRAMPCELLPSGKLVAAGFNGDTLFTPDIAIEVSGSPVSIHRVELDRDLFYKSADHATNYRASLDKYRDDRGQIQTDGEPKVLRKDEFFCLGDNSPFSLDSRGWGAYDVDTGQVLDNNVDYWVKKRTFAEGTGDIDANGVVPARLMMGRAFFVYFPAPHGLTGSSFPFVPNFGDMRFIH